MLSDWMSPLLAVSLNRKGPLGSLATGQNSLGERAPFPLLLAQEIVSFGDGIHENLGDAL